MPIPSYSGETCVGFLDISGFKKMMERGVRAERTLNKFYNTIFRVGSQFNVARSNTVKVRSLVVSDCAVIFIDNNELVQDRVRDLQTILRFIQRVNRDLVTSRGGLSIMTTCSIDYGRFKYEDRIEFRGIGKDYFFGQPYVKAFLDNEKLKSKPGYCRALRRNLNIPNNYRTSPPLSLLETEEDYHYFYWMLNSLDELPSFKREYEDISQSVYTKMVSLLREFERQSTRSTRVRN